MTLAPLADVVAYLDRRSSRLAGVRRAVEGRFDATWSPSQACVVATRALPRSVPDGPDLRAAGVAFAEGRDTVAGRPLGDLRLLESLPGDVGFVRAGSDNLVVVRSGPGTVPWYAWKDSERALVTTSFTELVRLLPGAAEPDPLVWALWGSSWGVFPDGRSFVRGVTVIPPGHAAEVAPGQPVVTRLWWDPWTDQLPWPSAATRAHHVERFRHAVLCALEREVAEDPVNLLSLSGGVDSSALAYLAGRHLGRPVATMSFVAPGAGGDARVERSYLDPLIADLGIERHTRRPLDLADRLALADEGPPVAFPVLHPILQVLPGLVEDHPVEVLFGGEFADEVCGGWFTYPDWLDAVSLPRLITRPRRLPRGPRDLAAWSRRRLTRRRGSGPWPGSLGTWVRPEIEAEYQRWRAEQVEKLRASPAPNRHQRAVRACLGEVPSMNWEVCSHLGVRRAFPFLTADVLRVVSACHPAELLGPGPKRLERQAFAGLVPDRHLQRPDKGGWSGETDGAAPAQMETVPASLQVVVREGAEPHGLVEAIGLRVLSRFAEHLAAAQAGAAATPK